MQFSSKSGDSSPIMMSSLRIRNLKIDKFDYFSSDIVFNRKTDMFRKVIPFIIN